MLSFHDPRLSRRAFLRVGSLPIAGMSLASLLERKVLVPLAGGCLKIVRSFFCICMAGRARSKHLIPK